MSNETQFINGLIVKAPNENAPEYVKAKLSIKRLEMIAWLQEQSGDWINADIKVSQAGKWYSAVDTWKPNSEKPQSRPAQSAPKSTGGSVAGDMDDPIPFSPLSKRSHW